MMADLDLLSYDPEHDEQGTETVWRMTHSQRLQGVNMHRKT